MYRENIIPKIKTKPPGKNSQAWIKFHKKYAATTTYAYGFVWDFTKESIGPFCQDPDGNTFMDFVSNVGASPLGYNNPKILGALKELNLVDPLKIAGQDFYLASAEKLKKAKIPTPSFLEEKLIKITKKFRFDTVFLSNSGAEAVENAIKICYSHAKIPIYGVTFARAFHGRTLGALSLTRSKTIQRKRYPQIPNIIDLPYCSCKKKCDCGWKVYSRKKGKIMTRLEQEIDKDVGVVDPNEVAYIIIEAIQGEGGYNLANREFMRTVAKAAKQNNIHLIVDEIQSGLGRTGKWWAIEHFGVKPSIITSAKGLRIGATIASRKEFPKEQGRISSTWGGGDIINSLVGYKTLEVIEKERLLRNAAKRGKYFLKRLRELDEKYSSITEVRGLGLMDAVEFKTQVQRNETSLKCFKNGLLTLGCGYKTLRLLPPLDVTKRELDISVDILDKVLKEV